jgi:hypothetical protein
MTTKGHPLLGKWRITDMEPWDAEFIDLLGLGYFQFDPDGGGDANLEEDGTITGEIRFHRGDHSTFTAPRW